MKAGDIVETHAGGDIIFGLKRRGTYRDGYFHYREIRKPKPGIHQQLIIDTWNPETEERTQINLVSQFIRLFFYKAFKKAASKKAQASHDAHLNIQLKRK